MPENRASSKDALEEVYISTTGSLGKLCLTFNAKTATDGSRLRLSPCIDIPQSKWHLKQGKSSPWFQIVSSDGTKSECLDVVGNADILQLWSCVNFHNNQLFEVTQDGVIVVQSTADCLGYKRMNNYHKNKYPTENDPVISVKCDSKYAIKWTYLAVQKEDAHFNVLKPQAAKSVVPSTPLIKEDDTNGGYDEDENDVNSDDTYLDRLRKFLLLMSLLFFIAFCGYLMFFLIRRDRTGRGKKRDDEHV